MIKINGYKAKVRRALRSSGRYAPEVEGQIASLASAMFTEALASRQIEGLEEVTVLEQTRYGSKLAPHPAFKVQRDAQDQITRQMKALGLTVADVLGAPEVRTPLDELTDILNNGDA